MRRLAFIVLFSFIFCSYLYSQQYDDLQSRAISNDRLKQFRDRNRGKIIFFFSLLMTKPR